MGQFLENHQESKGYVRWHQYAPEKPTLGFVVPKIRRTLNQFWHIFFHFWNIVQCQLLINGQEENLPEIAIYSKSKDKFCLQHVKVRTQNDVDFFRCFIKDFSNFIRWTTLDKSCVGSCHYI